MLNLERTPNFLFHWSEFMITPKEYSFKNETSSGDEIDTEEFQNDKISIIIKNRKMLPSGWDQPNVLDN